MKLKGKITVGKFTKEDARKAARKAGREIDLTNSIGWVAVRKAHKSVKDYTRKPKHKKDYSFE